MFASAITRDLSTDKQQKPIEPLNNFTLSDLSQKMRNFHHWFRNGPSGKILIHCGFPDLPIGFCEQKCIEAP